MGRAAAAPAGIAPGSIAILPAAPDQNTPRYGNIITGTFDITQAPISSTGMDECLVWWKICTVSTTNDVNNGEGVTSGLNTPALRQQTETSNEVAGFFVYASNDNGATWYNTPYMEPVDLTASGTNLRLAFINTDRNTKIYLQGFCVMFSDIVP